MRELVTLGFCMLALASCSIDQTTSIDGNAGEPGVDSGNAGAAGGGGFPGVEDCENALDEDSDGMIDCADSDCSTYACAPIVPAGWTGPVALYLGVDAPPDCSASGGFASLDLEGGTLEVPSYACPACGCDPAAASCTPTVVTYSEPGCTGQLLSMNATGCQTFNASSNQRSIKLVINPPAGACTPSSNAPTIPPPTLVEKARVCGLPGGSRAGGGCFAEACVPKPTVPFSLCIYGKDAACPQSYPTSHIIVTAFEDQRGCAGCTCSTGCTGAAIGYDFCGDTTELAKAVSHDQCVLLSSQQSNLGVLMTGAVNCAPAGGEPLGSVLRTELTLCCKS